MAGASDYSRSTAERVLGLVFTRQGRAGARDLLDRVWVRADTSREMQLLCDAAAAQAAHAWFEPDGPPPPLKRFGAVLSEATGKGMAWSGGHFALWLWEVGEISEPPEGIAEPYRLLINGQADEAAVIFENKGMPYERALALRHCDHAARLQALAIFEALGADPLAARLRKALRE